MKVDFANFAALNHRYFERYKEEFANFLTAGRYINGPAVEKFESQFKSVAHQNYTVGVSNGLDALEIALKSIGVGPGDEVIVPSNTYIATWLAVSNVGAKIVPLEPDEATHLADLTKLQPLVTSKTKAVILVHLYGKRCDINACRKMLPSNVKIIDDCAQSHGASILSQDDISDVSCWSFYPGKNLGALGDGGAVTTDDPEIAQFCQVYRNYGSSEKYVNVIKGSNRRLDELQATFLSVKLEHLKEEVDYRRSVASNYLSHINNPHIILPSQASGHHDAWHLFVIRTQFRDLLKQYLKDNGIETLIHYPIPPHKQVAYQGCSNFLLPNAERLSREVISLPCNSYITIEQQEFVIKTLNNYSPDFS